MSKATPIDDGRCPYLLADGIPTRRRTAAITLSPAPDYPACQVFFDLVHVIP